MSSGFLYPSAFMRVTGYRHIDTARIYSNEEDVGMAVKASRLPRDQIFVTTKIWSADYDDARAATVNSLKRLDMDYADLILLHSPGSSPRSRRAAWETLEALQAEGKVRSIGVSNFGIPHLESMLKYAKVVPAVNQIELSPFLQRQELAKYCQTKGIVVEAYSPLCKAKKLKDPTVMKVAERNKVTPAQVLIRWSLQKGYVPLPKSVNPQRIETNFDVFSFELSPLDMNALDALEEGYITGWDPIAYDPA
eukprot:jgi/Botrbrau1/12823/Bobra.20_1s0013.2